MLLCIYTPLKFKEISFNLEHAGNNWFRLDRDTLTYMLHTFKFLEITLGCVCNYVRSHYLTDLLV